MRVHYDAEKDITVIQIKPHKDSPFIDSHICLKGHFEKDGSINRDILPNSLQISENRLGFKIFDRLGQHVQITDKDGNPTTQMNERIEIEISDSANESLVKFYDLKTGKLTRFINYFYQKKETAVCTSICDIDAPVMIYEEADKKTFLNFDERGTFQNGYTLSSDKTMKVLTTKEAGDLYFSICLDSVLLRQESQTTRLAPLIGFRNNNVQPTTYSYTNQDIDFSPDFYAHVHQSKQRHLKKKRHRLIKQIIAYLACATVFGGGVIYLETLEKNPQTPPHDTSLPPKNVNRDEQQSATHQKNLPIHPLNKTNIHD